MSEPEYCIFQVYRATLEQPAEYCPNDAEPGYEYCLDHMPYDEPDPDDERDRLRDREWEGDYE